MDDLPCSGMVLLTGNSHPEMAKAVAEGLKIELGEAKVYNVANKETLVEIKDSVRGKHVFILQSGSENVNQDVMELLLLVSGCKTASSKSVTVIMPYLPYSQQCRMRRRSGIAMKLLAEMICKAGANRMITLDMYKKEIQGFFSCPVDNLRASPFFLQHIKTNIPDYKNAIIVAKSPGVMNKATSYADRLRLGVAVIHGEQKDEDESGLEDGRQSPPPDVAPCGSLPAHRSKQKPPLSLVGKIRGRIAIMVDDIIDEAHSFVAAAELLKERGAKKIYVIATHGVLSSDAPALLEASPITEIIVTNTVPHDPQNMGCNKIKTVDVSSLISEAIRLIFNNESLAPLFRDITSDD